MEAGYRKYMDLMICEMVWGKNGFSDSVTSSTEATESTLDVEELMRKCNQVLEDALKNRLDFVVSAYHFGGIRQHDTDAGTIVYMSPGQARMIHKEWPLKLVEILSAHSAIYRPFYSTIAEMWPKSDPLFPPFTSMMMETKNEKCEDVQ